VYESHVGQYDERLLNPREVSANWDAGRPLVFAESYVTVVGLVLKNQRGVGL